MDIRRLRFHGRRRGAGAMDIKQQLRDDLAHATKRLADIDANLKDIWQAACDYDARGDALASFSAIPYWVIRGKYLQHQQRRWRKKLNCYEALAKVALVVIGAMVFSHAAPAQPPPPVAPPGSGTAEWTFHRTLTMEAPVLRDANYAHACGLRSSGWFNTLLFSARIVNTELYKEQRAKAADSALFEAYANADLAWFASTWRQHEPLDARTCTRVAGKLGQLDALVDRMTYR